MPADGFDFCHAMRVLCDDITRRHAEFRHIQMSRVVVAYAQTRSASEWGMQAKLTPLRFERGATTEVRGGQRYAVQRLVHNGQDMLYILTFYLPRFLNLSYSEKLVTVFHELYHISPAFDGDIRRFEGSCYMHTSSQAAYDQQMAVYARQYTRSGAPVRLRVFLKGTFQSICRNYGPVMGLRVPIPRVIPLGDAA